MNFQEYGAAITGELAQVFSRMNDDSVMPLLEKLKKANRIIAHAGGREGISMRPFVMRLAHMGFNSHWLYDDTTVACGSGDIYVTSSGSGDTDNSIYDAAKRAKKTGGFLVLFTAVPNSEFAKLADMVVTIPGAAYHVKEGVVPTIQLMGNQYEQALYLVLDTVIMMLKDQLGISEQDMEARHRNIE